MLKSRMKKLLGAILASAMMAATISGCGSSNVANESPAGTSEVSLPQESGTVDTQTQDENSGEDALEPMEISLSIWGIQEAFDNSNAANDTIFNDLCKKFNVTINPVGVTWEDYQEKNKVWAASGSLPDVFVDALVTDNNGLYQTWAKQGIIKELPSDLSKYKNLAQVMELDSVKALAIDGKYYMVPRGGDLSIEPTEKDPMSRIIYYRKDWAEAAGYSEVPDNFDDFIEMVKAMMEQHPDATGISMNSPGYLGTLALDIYPELVNTQSWVFENEQWIPCYASERTVPYIERLQKLYQDGIMDPDFMTQKDGDAIAKFLSGHSCTILGGEVNTTTFMESNPEVKNFSDAFGYIVPFQAQDGKKYVFANTPYWSESYVNAVVDDAKMERILMIIDYMYSHEYGILVKNGIEGVDWEMKDGKAVSLLSEGELLSDKYPITNCIGFLSSWFSGFELSGDQVTSNNPAQAQYDELFRETNIYCRENCEAAPINFDVFLMNNEEKKQISDFGSKFVDSVNNIIVSGEDPKTGWKQMVDDFTAQGMDKAIDAVTNQANSEGITAK